MFEVACSHCAMRLAVDRIRDAEVTVMACHLREHHPELRLGATAALGAILDHYGVTPTDPDETPPEAG